MFTNECKLINLKYEYEGYTGTEKWAIVTELSQNELLEKYSDVIKKYTPFVLLSIEQGEIINEYNRNEDKFKKRRLNCEDALGYDEGISEAFHNELASPDYWQEQEEAEARKRREVLYELLDKALDTLTPTQRKRLLAYLVDGKSSRIIAKEEGVNYSKVEKSVAAGIKKIKKFFENGGAFEGGNSK